MNLVELENPIVEGKASPGVEQTDLASLVAHSQRVDADATLEEVYQQFRTHEEEFCAVTESGSVIGLLSRGHLGYLLGHRFGFSVYGHDPARRHLVEQPLMLRQGTPIRQVLEMSLGRQGRAFDEHVILLGTEDQYLGIIPVPALVRLQSALVEERFRIQEAMHRRLLEVSRQAGMAEVASGVLHNVGNVLTSVNVSAHLLVEMVQESKLTSLEKIAALLEQNRGQMDAFLSADPKGKLIPEFIIQFSGQLRFERDRQLAELKALAQHLGHIKNIISMQQQYAKVSGVLESVQVNELVEDSLRMTAEALQRHRVQVVRRFSPVPPVVVDKHKVLQILVNLISNAKDATDLGLGPEKRIAVSIDSPSAEQVRIQVEDNGVGIPPENLKRIFSHGFTTKKDGHGFGLHSSALAAKEMDGALRVHSEGVGRGTVFTLELPVKRERARG